MELVPFDAPLTSARADRIGSALAEAYPLIRREPLGSTDYGRPLWALSMGTGKRVVLYTAAHHANEWITAPVLLRFAQELAEAQASDGTVAGVPARKILTQATITLVPMVNPDGVDLVTAALGPGMPQYDKARRIAESYPEIPFPSGWKANLNGVDLNLNYPAGWNIARDNKFRQGFRSPAPRDFVGKAPLDQPETQALADLVRRLRPDRVLAFHTQGQVIYDRYAGIDVPGSRVLAEEFSRVSGYEIAEVPYLSSFAGFKDWFIQEFRRPGFTVEAGLGENPLPVSQLPEIYRNTLGILVSAAVTDA